MSQLSSSCEATSNASHALRCTSTHHDCPLDCKRGTDCIFCHETLDVQSTSNTPQLDVQVLVISTLQEQIKSLISENARLRQALHQAYTEHHS